LKISIPQYVKSAIKTLNDNGYEAFVVGGAVRDAILGTNPKDWDITTNADVTAIQNSFEKHFDTGIKHGTITVLVDNNPIEITTYRIDGEYKDNRHPKSVQFTKNLSEDLKRRDFTINAMAYNHKDGLVDLENGIDDLKNGIIRCVDNPNVRFNEDALRILRAIRFASRLNFKIETATFDAIKKHKELLKNISAERIREEFLGIIMTDCGVSMLFETGVAKVIMPKITFESKAVKNVDNIKILKLASILAECSFNDAKDFLTTYKFDNKTKKDVLKILSVKEEKFQNSEYFIRKLISKYGKESVNYGIKLRLALGENTKEYQDLFDVVKDQPCSIKSLDINGKDLESLGITGVKTGNILNKLLEEVLKNPTINCKETLTQLANKLK